MTPRPWVVHPFLVAPLPVLLIQARNADAVPFGQVVVPSSLALAAAAAGLGALRLARLDGPRAGLIVSAALALFLGFGSGVRLAGRLGLGGSPVDRERLVLAAEGLILAAGVVGLVRRPGLARPLNGAANAGSAAMVGFWLWGMAADAWTRPRPPTPALAGPVKPVPAPSRSRPPDVFLLVLDAYGRSDVLKEVHGLDNSAFLDRLRAKGFFVASRGTSNYCQTVLSLAATLNLRYLDDLAGSPSSSRLPARDLIQSARAFAEFRARGYRIATFATGFDPTELRRADRSWGPPGNLPPFAALVAGQTPLWLLTGQGGRHDPHRLHRERVLQVFDRWPEAPFDDAPTFCFAHVLAPHPPFVFGLDGRDTSSREGPYTINDGEGWRALPGHGGPEEYAARYREEAAYVTARVERAVDRILARPGPSPVIILMGDHGPGSHFDSGSPRPNDLRERFGNLNAIHLPGGSREGMDEAMTPVNTFRVVLDRAFGTTLGRLPDRNFYSPYNRPYDFTEVTAELAR